MKAFAVFALAVVLVSGASAAHADDPIVSDVYKSIRDRLALMKPVAAWKVLRQLPVEDVERERVVLQSSIEKAEAVRVDGATARMFFKAQIEAAKEIQSCWMDRWAKGEPKAPETAPDLVREVRPELIRLGSDILRSIARTFKEGEGPPFDPAGEPEFIASIDVDCLSEDGKREIYRALLAVQPLE